MHCRAICSLYSIARFAVPCHFFVIHGFFRNLELKLSNPVAAVLSLLWSNAAGI
jgi:hypothetical protein